LPAELTATLELAADIAQNSKAPATLAPRHQSGDHGQATAVHDSGKPKMQPTWKQQNPELRTYQLSWGSHFGA
jgi:hypothetical protein